MSHNLFVGGFPYETTEQELARVFSACGPVVSVKILMERNTGRSRGIGFVEMGSDEAAQTAMRRLDGSTLGQRKIFVSVAKPPEKGSVGFERKPRSFEKRPRDFEPKPGFVERRSGKDRRQGGAPSGGDVQQRKPWERRPEGPADERKPWERKPAFGDKKKPWERKPAFGDKKKPWERKPGFGDKKPWERKDGPGGERKPWAGKPGGGFKKKWTGKPKKFGGGGFRGKP